MCLCLIIISTQLMYDVISFDALSGGFALLSFHTVNIHMKYEGVSSFHLWEVDFTHWR